MSKHESFVAKTINYIWGEKMRVAGVGFIALVGVVTVLSFQNCSKKQVVSMRGVRATLQSNSVFGNDSLASSSSDSAANTLGVDSSGRPIVPVTDVQVNTQDCPNCVTVLENQGLPANTQFAPCERVICEKDLTPKPNECAEGTTFVNGNCVGQCRPNEIYIDGKCQTRTQSCLVEGGSGIQYWASNSFGSCIAKNCDRNSGYQLSNSQCVKICAADEIYYQGQCHKLNAECQIPNGVGSQSWNGSGYSNCHLVSCSAGYREQSGACVPSCPIGENYFDGRCYLPKQNCPIANGVGEQDWTGTGYGSCHVTSCNDGFMSASNACVSRCSNTQVFANGQCNPRVIDCSVSFGSGTQTWTGNSYGACVVTNCQTAQGYVQSGNACVPRCQPSEVFSAGNCLPLVKNCTVTNGSGIQAWRGADYRACQATACNPGFRLQNGSCVSICRSTQFYSLTGGGKCLPKVAQCPISNGWGQQTWGGSAYGACEMVGCNAGFHAQGNFCIQDEVQWSGDGGMSVDPLIIDLGNHAEKISLSSQLKGVLFDLLGVFSRPTPNAKVLVSWTKNPRYRYVALPNDRGEILGVDQLFGDNTVGPDGRKSSDGFAALIKYDGMDVTGRTRVAPADGYINESDEIYKKLVLWSDMNGNGAVDAGETDSLADMGIESIDLKYDGNFYEVDKWGNTTAFKSVVKFKDGRETLIFDLWFRYFEPVGPGCYKID